MRNLIESLVNTHKDCHQEANPIPDSMNDETSKVPGHMQPTSLTGKMNVHN